MIIAKCFHTALSKFFGLITIIVLTHSDCDTGFLLVFHQGLLRGYPLSSPCFQANIAVICILQGLCTNWDSFSKHCICVLNTVSIRISLLRQIFLLCSITTGKVMVHDMGIETVFSTQKYTFINIFGCGKKT